MPPSDEDDPPDGGRPERERWSPERLLAEWRGCRSVRRLLIGLNEGGVDLGLLVDAVLKLVPVGKRAERRDRVLRVETHYEAIMELATVVGQVAVVATVFDLWPEPPPSLLIVPGKLEGSARMPGPSVRLWSHRAATGGDSAE